MKLGLFLDTEIFLEEEMADMARQPLHKSIQCATSLHHLSLHQEALPTVTHALVTPQLHYSNTLYVIMPLKTTQKLQPIQNAVYRQ